ncbi:unnamed protein product [Triticum turgidum subsp. durum]|uniref:RNA helicase n=1 Tax=Triticum turgidum subsp. durum TaxID=4567 RepID=A0A9R0PZ98_TRITD|nr:unnamed protein product [Triticum turgidum subsp. durum]
MAVSQLAVRRGPAVASCEKQSEWKIFDTSQNFSHPLEASNRSRSSTLVSSELTRCSTWQSTNLPCAEAPLLPAVENRVKGSEKKELHDSPIPPRGKSGAHYVHTAQEVCGGGPCSNGGSVSQLGARGRGWISYRPLEYEQSHLDKAFSTCQFGVSSLPRMKYNVSFLIFIILLRSKIVFKTAGVVLEQMRHKGFAALQYKVIILDEIHERSVESDLVLAYVKQFMMMTNDSRLVLMSATIDSTQYVEYFKDIGKVELITIPSSSCSNFQRKVQYLEQIVDILKMDSETESPRTKYCPGLDCKAEAYLSPDVYQLINKLLLHIHESERDTEKGILVFLPTYYALEQQWDVLSGCSIFKIHILHRSIDTDEALETMKASKSCRKVILATNMAESSVTIPGVAYVIDSCRSLQVYWNPVRRINSVKLVWISKSQISFAIISHFCFKIIPIAEEYMEARAFPYRLWSGAVCCEPLFNDSKGYLPGLGGHQVDHNQERNSLQVHNTKR